jgi:predicted transposase/invertase (TIGR01784 family)
LIEIIYLDEIEPNSLALGIIDLVVGSPKDTTAQKVQLLTTRTKETVGDSTLQKDIIELIERVIIYKFPQKSNKELEEMFGLAEWKETQFYKDVKLEGIKEGKLEGIKEGKLEGIKEGKLETIPLLVKLGLSPEQIAKELDIDLEIVKQEISKY